ncbi:hypothetical protein GTO10_01705 [Candidatus Saccharibacteria bacterium]|nr:hypothetical protein [Candidatus Saccharibacteria bacterium]
MRFNKALKIATVTLILLAAFLIIFARRIEEPQYQPPASETAAFSFLAFGDSGTGGDVQKALASLMDEEETTFAILTGDVVYPCGTKEGYKTRFGDIYAEFLESRAIYPSPGNHDYQCDSLSSYLSYFKEYGRYYSFEESGALFISLDTNNLDSTQITWIEEELSKATSTIRVVFFHHPPFSSGTVHGSNAQVQDKLVHLFDRYQVDLVFSGHEHNYERLEAGGVVYIVTGGGGATTYSLGAPLGSSKAKLQDNHFVRVDIEGCEATLAVVRASGELFDQVSYRVCDE